MSQEFSCVLYTNYCGNFFWEHLTFFICVPCNCKLLVYVNNVDLQ